MVTNYSYVKLSLNYSNTGGRVKFSYEAFGKSVFSDGINNFFRDGGTL